MVKFSIVIPAYNEEKYIRKTLQVLRKQTYTDYEVIVKDGKSQDRTARTSKELADTVISASDRSAADARNQGARHVHGEILVFMDADTFLPFDALERFAKLMKDESVVGVSCRKIPQSGGIIDRVMYEFVNFSTFASSKLRLGGAHGNCMLIRRSIFKQIGGFNPNIIVAEEQELVRRALRFGRYLFLLDFYVVENPRRLQKWGRLRLYVAWLTGMWTSFRARQRRRYEKVR
ncbi:MAG TPA: glycosyltransferase [Candidatus Bathyarchaeia archaeon]|nr:glycosyltransferase [Candidatus Bathyarchaeia archaeon]